MAVSFSGSLSISGSLNTTGTITMSGSIASASFANTASNATTASYVVSSVTDTSQNTRLTTIEAVTGSYALTSSLATSNSRISVLETVTGSYATTSSLSLTSASVAAINVRTGSYATTGSNFFIGTQVVTGSVYISSDLVVQGSSSLQNITASAVSIGTNRVILNTSTPILQFGGISVQDSGSSQGRSGSLFWDSLNDHWINVNPSGSDEGYNSAMVINGPKNTGSLGSEQGLTTNYIPVSQGEDHIADSIIYQSGSTNIGIGTTNPSTTLDVNGTGKFTSSNNTTTLTINPGSSATYQFKGNSTSGYTTTFNINDTALYIGHDSAARSLVLQTNSTDRLTILGSGKVGIGITNPTYTLEVNAANNVRFYGNSYTSLTIATTSGTDFSLTNRYTDNRFSIDASGFGEVMNFMSDGKVGIGTSLPNSLVEIVKSSNAGSGATFPRLSVANSLATQGNGSTTYNFADLRLAAGNAAVEVYLTATYAAGTWEPQGILNVGTNHPLSFKTNNTERMRILSGGNVGIGTTNPTQKLEVSGNIKLTSGGYIYGDGSNSDLSLSNNNGSILRYGSVLIKALAASIKLIATSEEISLQNNSGTIWMNTSGSVGIGTTSPKSILDIVQTTPTISITSQLNSEATTDNQTLAAITFYKHYGLSNSAGIRMLQAGGTSNYAQAHLTFLTTNDGNPYTSALYERMRITSGGNVGIGTTNPGEKFEASGSIKATGRTTSGTSVGGLSISYDGSIGYIESWNSSPILTRAYNYIAWDTSGTERMRIANSGYIGIGTTSPAHYLQISNGNLGMYSNSYGNTGLIRMYGTDNAEKYQQGLTSGGDFYQYTFSGMNHLIYTAGTVRLQITNGGTVQPGANGTQDLGTSSLRWGTVYTSDLSLSNGIGDYTIVEGENDLFLYNNKQNKVYKFVLAEVDPADATPKKS